MSILLNMKNRVTHLNQLVTRIYQRRERDRDFYAVSYRNALILLVLIASQTRYHYISFHIVLLDFGSDSG
jgi:hypothetical protein